MNIITGLLNEIEKLKTTSIPIIIEGKRDKIALSKLGLTNTVLLKKPIYELCEDLARKNNEVVILTDLDKEGKKLYSIIKQNLERNGVKVNDTFRKFLFRYTKLSHIEGLDTYIHNLSEKGISL